MNMIYLSGRSFSSLTTGIKNQDGTWTVIVRMNEVLSYPNGTDREEVIEDSCTDVDFDIAHKTAMKGVLQQLEDLVYSKGFDSLIEGKDYERSLEEDNDLTPKSDEAAKPE